MLEYKDYLSSLNKTRRKCNQNIGPRYLLLLLVAVILVGLIVVGIKTVEKSASGWVAGSTPSQEGQIATPVQVQVEGSLSPKEETVRKEEEKIDKTISPYTNPGIVWVSGYLNIRETPSTDGKIIGKLSGDGTCEILGTEGDWSRITSGGVDRYISNQYPFTGEEARAKAKELAKLRATVTADNLNIRQAPELDPNNVVGQALKGEWHMALGQQGGWIQIEEGYTSADYADVSYSLNEGRKLDMEAMATNQYDNLVIPKANNYLNVWTEPKQDGKVIGKMISKAADEILETLNRWYKIKSDSIIDYISADPWFMVAGQEAKDVAIQTTASKAATNTDMLNVCTEPSTDSKIQTQIVKGERYPVVAQLDGRVEIELDSVDEEDGSTKGKVYISTRGNNVEVRYALNEAIKFLPQEVAANNVASRRSQTVNYALQFVGNPYVWGGTNLTKGVDCSGFTMKIMEHFGVSLPHYSGSQARMGKAVTSGNMRPGDLISYTGSGGKINHVSTYIGNGQVVHAASRKSGIKISTWDYRSPVVIRNVLGD